MKVHVAPVNSYTEILRRADVSFLPVGHNLNLSVLQADSPSLNYPNLHYSYDLMSAIRPGLVVC